ncbi:MAG: ABC transporter ATP-binding protein [Acidimicrobiales bacterium]|nr:MAG: ABC transporter ATP-binding protein [Acidimicrobiales bacterium]
MTDTTVAFEPSIRNGETLLEVDDLTVVFDTEDGVVQAVSDMTWSLAAGETLAILGESGSGKSVSVQTLMGLIPKPPGRVVKGSIRYRGEELVDASAAKLRQIRGSEIAMIFQDPLSALNPVYRVGWQIAEMFRIHRGASRSDANRRAVELMERVGIPNAAARARQYPHEFSGGMRQRAMIAMALALDPKVLIADEPTTALDVTVQAQIMELLQEIQRDTGMGLVLITHDLGVVASVADRVVVMYAGRTVETGPADPFYAAPAHPYAQGLMNSVPRLLGERFRLESIPGSPPSAINMPNGCAFHPRCPHAVDRCHQERPAFVELTDRPGGAACHRTGEF